MNQEVFLRLRDPLVFCKFLWPEVVFYDRQVEIIYSIINNDETYVPAGNMLGKDFVSGFIALWFFLTRHPVKIITTSATEKHLGTLWGEIDRFIRTSRVPLSVNDGGPLYYTSKDIRKVVNKVTEVDSFISGMVASSTNKGEGLAGHHSKNTLCIIDEASGVPDIAYDMAQGWAKRMLIIGNPNECNNFFRRGVKGGDILAKPLGDV